MILRGVPILDVFFAPAAEGTELALKDTKDIVQILSWP